MPKSEQNESVYFNEVLNKPTLDENNVNSQTLTGTKIRQDKSNKLNLKLLSSFVFLCAAVVVLQVGIYIPIFSEVFSPSPPAPTIVITPNYVFSSVVATDSKINFSLQLDNVDLTTENYNIYLVKQSNATDTYINSIPASIRESEQIKIKNQLDTYNITKHITPMGGVAISPSTDYSIIVVNEKKIVQSYNITTTPKIYLSNVNVYFADGNINITLKADDSFTGFGTLLIQVENLTDSTWGAEHNGIDRTTGSEANIPADKYNFPASKGKVDQYFEVKIYCVTTDLEKKALPDTITHGDPLNPEYYYLIYTYDKPLILKGV